ncbi:MAG: Beta-lactamase hydrolase-like protein [Syntrophorhabdus sp. PtaU1.Bin058]|nr:MAG: Beta-lactamase hydrolase-like protein [Syntrophorhabdus sp. PtaU1.Bin058]
MFVKQIQVGSFAVFAYIVACKVTKDALVIDPAGECERILQEAADKGYTIKYIVNTHCHVDHIMGNKRMKDLTGAEIIIHEKEAYSLVHQSAYSFSMFGGEPSPPADITVKDGDYINIGETSLQVIHTPGHSPGSISLYHKGMVFTGDTLFVGGVGRTDLDGGSWEVLLSSVRNKLFVLPDDTIVAPGHNYGDTPRSTIGHEKQYNPYVGQRGGY